MFRNRSVVTTASAKPIRCPSCKGKRIVMGYDHFHGNGVSLEPNRLKMVQCRTCGGKGQVMGKKATN